MVGRSGKWGRPPQSTTLGQSRALVSAGPTWAGPDALAACIAALIRLYQTDVTDRRAQASGHPHQSMTLSPSRGRLELVVFQVIGILGYFHQ